MMEHVILTLTIGEKHADLKIPTAELGGDFHTFAKRHLEPALTLLLKFCELPYFGRKEMERLHAELTSKGIVL